jgi:argininosuccinate lyase
VAFRDAHEAVGKIVGYCSRDQVDIRSLSLEKLCEFNPAFPASAAELLDLRRSLEQRNAPGGTARANVEAELNRVQEELEAEAERLEAEEKERAEQMA